MNDGNTKRQENTKTTYKHFFRKPYYNYRKPFVKRYLEPKSNQLQSNLPIKRSKSNDNLNKQNNQNIDVEALINSIKTFVDNKFKDVSENISTKLRNSINAQVENRCKYYIDQRIGLMLNSDDLLTRGSNSFTISPDAVHGAKAFYFNYMHEPVAYFTYDGRLFCKGLFLNGVNILQTISKIFDDESSVAEALSNYVKHIELKDGTYELNVKDTVTDTLDANTGTIDNLTSTDITVNNDLTVNGISNLNTLYVKPDSNNVLEYPSREYTDRALFILTSGTRTIGYSFFYPTMANKTYVVGMQVGKDLGTGNWGGIRWYHYNTNNASNFISMSAKDGYDTLRCKQDGTVYIRSPTANTNALWIQYEGNLSNNNYQRINIGDNRALATYAYGREGSTNYAYMKLNGKNCELRVYDTYMNVNGSDAHYIRRSGASGTIAQFLMSGLTNDNICGIILGREASLNNTALIEYKRATTPLLGLGFYQNSGELLTLDPSGNCNIRNSLTAGNATLASTSVNDLYSAGIVNVDSTINCHKLNISDVNINTDYLHIIASGQTLTNNDYLRFRLSDSVGDGIIDLFHDTMYYGLRLKIPTGNNDDNKLCIYPTGVTIDGQLDCYDNVNIWDNLEVSGTLTASTSITTPTMTVTNIDATNLSASNIYASTGVTVDGTVLMAMSDIADIYDNKDYLKLRYEGTLADTHYIRMHMKDSSSNAYIDLVNNAGTYELQLKCGGGQIKLDDNNNLYIPDTECSGTISVDNISSTSGSSMIEINTGTVKVTNGNNDAILQTDNLNVIDEFTLNTTTVNGITTSTDINNQTNIDDDHLITAAGANALKSNYTVTPPSTITNLTFGRSYVDWLAAINAEIKAITYGHGIYVALLDNSSNYYCYSSDGIHWEQGYFSASGDRRCICYGKGRFVTPVWNTTNINYSLDGINWYTRNCPTQRNWNACGYGNGMYIILSGSQTAIYSTDGMMWTEFNMGVPNGNYKWTDICYGNGVWVATINNSNKIAYSTSGNSGWTLVNTNATYNTNWQSVAYGNGIFIAVSYIIDEYPSYIISTDGINWTEGSSDYSLDFASITYGNGWFVAGSTWGELEWTKDGINWNGTTYGSPNHFNSICAGPDKIVTLTTGKHLSGDLYVMSPYTTYTTTDFYPQPTYSADLDTLSQMIIGRIYPVGAIYTSMNPVNPATLFGFGTWEMIEDQFLYCTPGPSGDHNKSGLNALDGNIGVTGSGLGGLQPSSTYYPARILCVEGSYTNTKASFKALSEYGWDVNPPYLSVYAWKRIA